VLFWLREIVPRTAHELLLEQLDSLLLRRLRLEVRVELTLRNPADAPPPFAGVLGAQFLDDVRVLRPARRTAPFPSARLSSG
jgi:hypothetical protein